MSCNGIIVAWPEGHERAPSPVLQEGQDAAFPAWDVPATTTIVQEPAVTTHSVKVYCSCRLPLDRRQKMAHCSLCGMWYHKACANILDSVFRKKAILLHVTFACKLTVCRYSSVVVVITRQFLLLFIYASTDGLRNLLRILRIPNRLRSAFYRRGRFLECTEHIRYTYTWLLRVSAPPVSSPMNFKRPWGLTRKNVVHTVGSFIHPK